jgi:parallel beta-helix repeat protein
MKGFFVAVLVGFVVVAGVLAALVDRARIPPRELGPYLEHRASGHRAAIVKVVREFDHALLAVDRGEPAAHHPMPVPVLAATPAPGPLRIVTVTSADDARRAIADAHAGDAITFAPGTYRFEGRSIAVQRAGTADAPIVVRADVPGSVVLEFDILEGFHVMAPYWTFENLVIRGVCRDHSDCEHAFHVVGNGSHFVARHNEIVDFNAHFKVNRSRDAFPDDGRIEGNVLTNTTARDTPNPVTPIDLVAASRWSIVGNRISDFVKVQRTGPSYGAFVKGGGSDNRIERNVVVCEDRLRGMPGDRVGLSLGDGGTAPAVCRDGRCITEQERSVIASNLVASCSDDGIYIFRSAMSVVRDNTLLDTAGIMARGGESSVDVDGNLVDGVIRAVDGATLHGGDNITTSAASLYVGSHPVRRLFVDAEALDLRWRDAPPRRQRPATVPADLCGVTGVSRPAYGAFEDVAECARSAARMRSTSAVVERR